MSNTVICDLSVRIMSFTSLAGSSEEFVNASAVLPFVWSLNHKLIL